MNQKLITLLIAILIIALGGGAIFLVSSKESKANTPSSNTQENQLNKEDKKQNETPTNDKKIAVIYFSASGTTKSVASIISQKTNAELIEIVPKEKYTSADLNWNDPNSRTSLECNEASSRPEIASTMNLDDYDVIYLGYPIWWGDVPHIILTFMDTYKLDGKTVIPFCTSGGTGISQSMNTLKNYNPKVHWTDGKRLSTSESEINNWLKSIKY